MDCAFLLVMPIGYLYNQPDKAHETYDRPRGIPPHNKGLCSHVTYVNVI